MNSWSSGNPKVVPEGTLASPLFSFCISSCTIVNFVQLPLSLDYQYVLVVVCLFSGWVEAFLCHKEAVRKCVSHLGYTFQELPRGYLHSLTCHCFPS